MKLYELLKRILESNSEQWNRISCRGYRSGLSYKNKNKLEFYEVYNGQENVLHIESHSNISKFNEDIDITMSYGITTNEDFKAEWANKFPFPSAYSKILDIFYRGILVFIETYFEVNRGQSEFSIPSYGENQELIVARK